MQLFDRGGICQVSYQEPSGRQVRRSLKTRNKQIAKQLIAKLELEIHEEVVFGKEPKRYFKEMLANYLEAKQQSKDFERLRHAAKHLAAFFDDRELGKLREKDVEKYCRSRGNTVKAGTVRREVGVLSAAFNHAIIKHHWVIQNPCTKASIPRKPKSRVRWITVAEASQLIAAARSPLDQQGQPLPARNVSTAPADFIELALNTGCRKSELLSLKWEHVDFSTRLLRLEETKSRDWQTVPINEAARQVLKRRLAFRATLCPSSPYVFFHEKNRPGAKLGDRIQNLRRSFARACVQVGITNFTIHDLRHTFASWLVMNGTTLFEVSKLLRHSSVTMTEIYAHLAPDQLHDAVGKLGFTAQFQHSDDDKKNVALKMV